VTGTSFILALAGAPSSGKTTVARSIAADTGATHVSFGDFLRGEAGSRHMKTDRSALQALGATLLEDLGPRGFCEHALSNAGGTMSARPVIWDGVRHVPVLDELRGLYAPAPVTFVVLAPPEQARRQRFSAAASSREELDAWESHESESQLAQLIAQADFVYDASSPQSVIVEVLSMLANRK
jgi:dephospho-CoA kinase